ncbi:MAG: pectate lyase [Bacteroidia bacterium]
MIILLFFAAGLAAQQQAQSIHWREALRQEEGWYAGTEAVRIADNLLVYQLPSGGWPKNVDMARPLTKEEKSEITQAQKDPFDELGQSTIDNNATYDQMRFLAKVYEKTEENCFKKGFNRGLGYLLEAQYENGGWPQFYPLKEGYYQHITFNDGAMMGVMQLLREIANGDFEFVQEAKRTLAREAIDKGLDLILKTQVEVSGRPTAWCAQYDALSLEPATARTYELPSISGAESVAIVEYLMEIEKPTPEVIRAVKAAVAWFEEVKIPCLRLIRNPDSTAPRGYDLVIGFDPASKEDHWARFYEIGTNYPMFIDRDGIVKYAISEIGIERRTGYRWLGQWAKPLIETEYPAWLKRHGLD